MKEIIIRIDEELYRRAMERTDDLEASVIARVTDHLDTLNGDDERIRAARVRMKELFDATTGFGVGQKFSREEMHDRESVR